MLNVYPSLQDYTYDVARGKVTGAKPFGGFGERTTAGAEINVLWPNGTYSLPSSAGVQMSLVSTSASDGVAGTGIRSIEIHYLTAVLEEGAETVVLNGTTPVLTVATNIRFIQYMHVVDYGSAKVAAGNISASNGGATYAQIAIGEVRDASSVRMVPAGKRAIVTSFFAGSISGTASARVTVHLATTNFDGHDYTTGPIFIPLASAAFQDTSGGITIPCPLAFTEGQTIGMTFQTDKAAEVVGSWFGWLENV